MDGHSRSLTDTVAVKVRGRRKRVNIERAECAMSGERLTLMNGLMWPTGTVARFHVSRGLMRPRRTPDYPGDGGWASMGR